MSKAGLVVLEQASDSWLGDTRHVDLAGIDKH